MSECQIAVLGCGYWGKNLVRNFRELGALSMVCDEKESSRGTALSLAPDVPLVSSIGQVLESAAVTAIVVATPAETHYALARRVLLAGKDVYVEKPLCLSDDEGEELVRLAETHDRVLMVGHLLQYHPCVNAIQEKMASGALGKLFYVSSNRLNLGKIRKEENALWSFAPHDISVILSLTGDRLPETVVCSGSAYLQSGICDTTLTAMSFSNGVRAHVYVSWLNPFKEQKLTVVGSLGMMVFDDTQPWNEKLKFFADYLTWDKGSVPVPNKTIGQPIVPAEEEPLRRECQHFLECCRDRKRPRTDGAEGVRVLKTLNLAQHSLNRNGAPVSPAGCSVSAQPAGKSDAPVSGAAQATPYFVHQTAVVDDGAVIGAGSKIWHFSHIMKGARIGMRCIVGQNVNIDGGAVIGNNVKIQNNVSVYSGLLIEDDVFLGPSCVLTNVTNPRSQINRHSLYEKTVIRRGATLGANSTIVCGIALGRYCFVGAGSVVVRDVPDYALVVGNPARHRGWMSRHGQPLRNPDADGIMICPESELRYKETSPGVVKCLDLDEDAPLPAHLTSGTRRYDEINARP